MIQTKVASAERSNTMLLLVMIQNSLSFYIQDFQTKKVVFLCFFFEEPAFGGYTYNNLLFSLVREQVLQQRIAEDSFA